MLSAFMDDSGSEGKGPVFVLAGFISYTEIWERFSASWAECLTKPPALPYLKMSQAKRLHDTFRGWSSADRDERIKQFTDVILAQKVMTANVFALYWDDFRRARDEHPEVADCHAYDMLFHGVMASVTRNLLKLDIPQSVEFVFDEQGYAGSRSIATYQSMKWKLPDELTMQVAGSPRLADDKIVLPLQAADLLAWHVRRYLAENKTIPVERVGGNGHQLIGLEKYPALNDLLGHQTIWNVYDYKRIKEIFESWTKPMRVIKEL